METRARRICVHRDGIHNYEPCDEYGARNGHPGQRHRNLSVPGCLTRRLCSQLIQWIEQNRNPTEDAIDIDLSPFASFV